MFTYYESDLEPEESSHTVSPNNLEGILFYLNSWNSRYFGRFHIIITISDMSHNVVVLLKFIESIGLELSSQATFGSIGLELSSQATFGSMENQSWWKPMLI